MRNGGSSDNPTGFRVEMSASVEPVFPPAPQFLGLFSTGVGDSGQVLGDGASDPHYTLVSGASADAAAAQVTNNVWPIGHAWLANSAASRWLSPRADQSGSSAPGFYTYRTTFTVSDGSQGIWLSGRVSCDDALVAVRLNGAAVSWTAGNPNYGYWTDFSLHEGFVEGANTLEFVVRNGGSSDNPTGFRVELKAEP